MSNISEVYGDSFQKKAVLDKALYAIKLYASNIAHKQFSFRNENNDMWQGHDMKPEVLQAFETYIKQNNKNMRIVHVDKGDAQSMNMFPYLIKGAVEYFVVVDMGTSKTQLYSLYITPLKMEAY